jgi:hypothetical protein
VSVGPMAASASRIHFQAIRNDGGIDLRIATDNRTVIVLKLSASELEELVRVIDDALDNNLNNEENNAMGDGE